MRLLALSLFMLPLSACVTADQLAGNAALDEQASTVRIVPKAQVETCRYVSEANIVQTMSFFGGMQSLEEDARKKLRREAIKAGANTIEITDRLLDKGRGGADQTRLSLYGNLYDCP